METQDRFTGCMLGLALGDAVGGRYEGMTSSYIKRLAPNIDALVPQKDIWYTDDTQMAIGVAEVLIETGKIDPDSLYQTFVQNYEPQRGYGRGARHVLEAGVDRYKRIAETLFPGGSYGNGAAMRVAPIGLYFYANETEIARQAHAQSLPTHVHPLGIEGAQLLAQAVGWLVRNPVFDREKFFEFLISKATQDVYTRLLSIAANLDTPDELDILGNGIAAQESVVTAIASFSLTPKHYTSTIANLIWLGGDVDTMAAMAGALSGTHLGLQSLPTSWLARLEKTPKGKTYLEELGKKLALAPLTH